MFMNDCLRAAFYLSEEGENVKRTLVNHQIHKTHTIIEKQTLPENSVEFLDGKTGKQNPGIKFIHWSRHWDIDG